MAAAPSPKLIPCLMISKGHVMIPGEEGPQIARTEEGRPVDVLETSERLLAEHGRLYVVDLEGIDGGEPQLDYLQEIARDGEIWVDVGARTSNDVIDALVTGARRAIVSSGRLRSERDLRRAWSLSQELVFEAELQDGQVRGPSPDWDRRPLSEVITSVRLVGIPDVVLSFRNTPVDWAAVSAVAGLGPTWVGGTFDPSDTSRLRASGAAGGIFHLNAETVLPPPTPPEAPTPRAG